MKHLGAVVTLAILGVAAGFGYLLASSPEEILAGPPQHVRVGNTSLCVGRQYVSPIDLSAVATESTPITGHPYGRVELHLFSVELSGFTAEHYRAGIAKVYDKRQYPADWIRTTVWANDVPESARKQHGSAFDRYYETESFVEFGFQSRRARRDCVGKVAGDGWVQIQSGPECLENELKYDHPVDPGMVFFCNLSRCWMRNRINRHDVWFNYDFPRAFLEQWPSLHAKILARVAEWREDKSCLR